MSTFFAKISKPIVRSMDEKITSKILLAAVKRKFPKAAILGEVTMTDEVEAERVRTAQAIMNPFYRKHYDKKGLTYQAELPTGYLPHIIPVDRRIDALIFEGNSRTAVEIKISRADFFRDTEEKRRPWIRHTNKFVYLVPSGLVKPTEVPEGCGLWEYHEGSIKSTKNARSNKEVEDFPQAMFKYFAWRAFLAEQKVR
jgi:hypothetical protein